MSDRVIPNAVLSVQHQASDPAASAWVSANAGSGKTYVLAQRVIRLLLDGTDPSKILCLTYTKAASANMANRVFERLAGWTTLSDEALEKEIRKTGVKRIDAKRLARARKLFAEALETPGGLKVQTIHAFCTRLLQTFPFEADVAARFQVLDETQQKQMIEAIRLDVLLAASAKPDSAEGRALATIITLASDFAFQLALAEAIQDREKVMAWLDRAGGIDGAMAELSQSLGIDADETIESVERELFDRVADRADGMAGVDRDRWRKGSTNDRDAGGPADSDAHRDRAGSLRGAALGLLHRRRRPPRRVSSPSASATATRPLRPLCERAETRLRAA